MIRILSGFLWNFHVLSTAGLLYMCIHTYVQWISRCWSSLALKLKPWFPSRETYAWNRCIEPWKSDLPQSGWWKRILKPYNEWKSNQLMLFGTSPVLTNRKCCTWTERIKCSIKNPIFGIPSSFRRFEKSPCGGCCHFQPPWGIIDALLFTQEVSFFFHGLNRFGEARLCSPLRYWKMRGICRV